MVRGDMDKEPIPLDYRTAPEMKNGSVPLQILRGIIWTVIILALVVIVWVAVIPLIYLSIVRH